VTTVGVVGLGAMGSRIAARLLDGGSDVVVWNRTAAKAQPLLSRGATGAASPADAAARADVLITMLADPQALEAVAAEIVGGAHHDLVVVEMSTIGPAAVADLRAVLPADVGLVDAPVLGSLDAVESGTLSIFAGGSDDAVARVRPVLESLGTVLHVGPLGSGAAAKLVANASLLGVIALLGEVLALAGRLELPRDVAYDVLARTPLEAQADRRRDAIARGEYPQRFALRLARKDADLVRHSAPDLGVLAETRTLLAAADDAGWGERDYTALLAWILERRNAA
jgi:3-hydroxyisobutyrate dehydrogenase-like beta-hydroxyacid dehydrogenase